VFVFPPRPPALFSPSPRASSKTLASLSLRRARGWSRRGALLLLAEPEPELLEYDVAAAAKTYRERRRARRRPPLRPAIVSILPNLLPRRGEPPTEFLVVLPFSPSLSRADAVVRVCFGCSLLQLVVCVVGTSTSSILVELRLPSLKGPSLSSFIFCSSSWPVTSARR
jgi:hypothetical protein